MPETTNPPAPVLSVKVNVEQFTCRVFIDVLTSNLSVERLDTFIFVDVDITSATICKLFPALRLDVPVSILFEKFNPLPILIFAVAKEGELKFVTVRLVVDRFVKLALFPHTFSLEYRLVPRRSVYK